MDDDQALLAFISEYLATIGMAVVTTVSGAEAMRCFHYARSIGQPFDLIFLDLVIPRGQGGRETLRQIRLVDTAVKVIISSGYANAPEVAQCRQFGFDGCLPKPYQGANLLQMAFEHLPGKYPEEQIVSGSN
jgi:CheY-like chemotaxis protein